MESGDKKLQPSPFAGAPKIPREYAERVCGIKGGYKTTCSYMGSAKVGRTGDEFHFCAKKVPVFKTLIDRQREAEGLTHTERNFCTGYPDVKPITH